MVRRGVHAMATAKEPPAINPLWAILAVFISFILTLFLGAFCLILFGVGPAMVLSELLIAVVPVGYVLYRRVDIKRYIGLEAKPRQILMGLAFGGFLVFFDIIVTGVLVSIFGVSARVEESNQLIVSMSSSTEGLILVVLTMLLAGICEEFTFRGFLLTSLSSINSKYSFGIALLGSSLAFGLIHFDPQAVYTISAFLIGLVLGFVYHRWHSYTISATAHATLNLVVLALSFLIR
jgi:membrane protease YdiL (CAAX protease family)